MICPKCKNKMIEINDSSFAALKCTGCSGIWFKDSIHDITNNVSAIDNEKTNSSSAYNEIKDISCPECNQKMTKMIDKSQHHISFESCRYCGGIFFDAGELKDLSTLTLIERIKETISTLKTNINA